MQVLELIGGPRVDGDGTLGAKEERGEAKEGYHREKSVCGLRLLEFRHGCSER